MFKSKGFIVAILAGGLVVGCKSKNTHSYAPVCTNEFVNAYTEVDQNSQDFQRLMNIYQTGSRDVRRQLTQAAKRLVNSCTYIYQQAQPSTCISSADSANSSPISASDFSTICDQADDFLDNGKSGDRGRWNNPGDSRPRNHNSRLEIKSLKADQLSMTIVDSRVVQTALDQNKPVSFINGQLVSLNSAAAAVQNSGQTACAIKTTQSRIKAQETPFARLSSRVTTSRSGISIEQVLLVSAHGLQISCQKEASRAMSFDDVYEALGGAIQLNMK